MMNSITRANLTAFVNDYSNKAFRYLHDGYNGTSWATIKKYIDMDTELVFYKHYVDPYEDNLMSSYGVEWDEDAELYYVTMYYHTYKIIGWKEVA